MNKKMLLTCLLFGISVLFLTGCQSAKPAPVAPAAPTPPAPVAQQPAPAEQPTPAPAEQPKENAPAPAPIPANTTPFQGEIVAIQGNTYTIEGIDFTGILSGAGLLLNQQQYTALSDTEKKEYETKRNTLIQNAQKTKKTILVDAKTIISLVVPGKNDATGKPSFTTTTGSQTDLVVGKSLAVLSTVNNNTYTAIRITILPPAPTTAPTTAPTQPNQQ